MTHTSMAKAAATGSAVSFDITDWSDEQVNRLRAAAGKIAAENVVTPLPADEDIEMTGWTEDAYMKAITQLLSKHHVQVGAIFEAGKTGNPFVSRDKVYEIGGYPETRSLKGFTRPVNRVQQDLVDEGLLPDDAADLLETAYDPTIAGYQRAIGFRVPLEIISIAQKAKAKHDATASA